MDQTVSIIKIKLKLDYFVGEWEAREEGDGGKRKEKLFASVFR